ncbi:MAG: DegV family protein [Clostridia bacterium]|nr:DegV family protein [Clostridia bacterium]
MNNFVIITDSGCDLSPLVLNEWGVEYIDLTFRFEGEDKEYSNNEMGSTSFYNRMKNGETAKTAAINPDKFTEAFENILNSGKDILYLGFSSGLSTTYNSSLIATEELLEKYPEQKIICVDTLAASAGQGLLVYFAVEKKNSGANIEDVAKYIDSIKLSLCHWFTVDDLVYLKRGGRISPAVAFVGAVLGIKPVLHVDNDGKLISVSKARGRKASLSALIEKYEQLADENAEKLAFISHADCDEDAEFVKDQLLKKFGTHTKIITNVGPVIGAHSGPGTLALFFIGKER